jgi:hypothetical protein
MQKRGILRLERACRLSMPFGDDDHLAGLDVAHKRAPMMSSAQVSEVRI